MKKPFVDSVLFFCSRFLFQTKKVLKRLLPKRVTNALKVLIRSLRKTFSNDEVVLPRYQHMSWASSRFSVGRPDDDGRAEIYWDGGHIYTTESLKRIHNSESGDCFLIGTGPSINDLDFSLLEKKACFGVNGAVAKFSGLNFDPKYYAISTLDFFVNRFDMVEEVVRKGIPCFFPFWGISRICEEDTKLFEGSRIFLSDSISQRFNIPKMSDTEFDAMAESDADFVLHGKLRGLNDKVGFSRDLLKGYFHGENIIYTALQIARYLGYRRFFILGMDLNYSGPSPRFYEKGGDSRPTWVDQSFDRSIVPCFEIVRELIRRGEMEVYNLSLQSRLPDDIIPKMSFEEAIAYSDADGTG